MSFYETFLSFRNTINNIINRCKTIDYAISEASDNFSVQSQNYENEYAAALRDNAENIRKVNAFVKVAEAHTSQCIMPTTPERFSSIELSKIAVLIDSTSYNNPLATKLYTKAQAQLMYLNQQEDVLGKIYKRQVDQLIIETANTTNQLNNKKAEIKSELIRYLSSDVIQSYVNQVKKIGGQFTNSAKDERLSSDCGSVFLGYLELELEEYQEYKKYFTQYLDAVYVSERNNLRFPYEKNLQEGGVLFVEYNNRTEQYIFSLIQNLILSVARYYTHFFEEITFVDPVRYNNSALGVVSALCEGKRPYISKVPTSPDNVKRKIESLIANLEAEENRVTQNDSSVLPKLLIFHDFPHGYDSMLVNKIRQLCVNASHYNYTIVLSSNVTERRSYIEDTIGYIKTISESISFSNDTFVKNDNSINVIVSFYDLPSEIPYDIKNNLIENRKVEKEGNEYINRVGLSWSFANKGNRYLESIPYGIDKENELLSLDFENSNFATFICGASRSGKSTLLHTILTGIFAKYHPDDVEIWLIDFKMTEFSRYIEHLPPHVRYLILDESPELVYDIINRLTEILIKRQNRFKGKWEKLSQVPKEKYMPSIFVVIDEFSVMSQIIADSVAVSNDNYSAKLQMLLAKGAALGLHFIFASQGFTNGTRGLSEYSKEQIQQRIAMKTLSTEIKATLGLKNASDTDIAMMEQLPVFHTLTRIPMDDFGNHLKLANVLYFPDKDREKQTAMIDEISNSLKTVPKFLPYDVNTYIDKKALVIDGNKYKTFSEEYINFKSYLSSKEDSNSVFFIGEPRRMLPIYPIEFSESFCENMIAIAPATEKMAFSSVLLSLAKTVELQGYSIKVIGHPKNPVFNQLLYGCHCTYEHINSLREICKEIALIKDRIVNGIENRAFYFLLGFETIINEMSFIDTINAVSNHHQSGRDEKLSSVEFEKREEGEMDLMQMMSLGLTGTTNSSGIFENSNKSDSKDNIHNNTMDPETQTVVEYDARADLKFILTQGSRLGYHFVMQFNSVNELEQTKTDLSFFRHKILFRVPRQDASSVVGASFSAVIPDLPDHVFRYHDGISAVSFRPFLHPGLSWDGWSVNEDGTFSDIDDDEEYLM